LDRVGTEPVQGLESLRGYRRDAEDAEGSIAANVTRADEWILARLDAAIVECDRALGPLQPTTAHASPDALVWKTDERYQGLKLNEYAEAARRFVWNELADWYLESLKGRMDTPGPDREVARAVLVHCFDHALRLLHPIVPFITESLWQRLPSHQAGEFLVKATWPVVRATQPSRAATEFETIREAVLAVRQIRGDNNVAPSKQIDVVVVPSSENAGGGTRALLESEAQTIGRLVRGNVRVASAASDVPGGAAAHAVLTGGTEVIVPLADLVDVEKECARLRGEVAELAKQIQAREGRLSNQKYVDKAPPAVVASDRQILADMKTKHEQLTEKVRSLCG
jgi:valyl-tRNA synthetase